MPKLEGRRVTSAAPQDGHATRVEDENRSFSNSTPQRSQRYSKTGIGHTLTQIERAVRLLA